MMRIKKNEEQAWDCLEAIDDKLKTQHNETVLSLQYCKLAREQNENDKEWMGHLRLKASECGWVKGKRQKTKRTIY